MEVAVYREERPVGTVTLSEGGGWAELRMSCLLDRTGLFRGFLACDGGELPLGVMEPQQGALAVCRRLYARDVAALGALRRGEARLSFRFGEGDWQAVREPGRLLVDPALRRCLEGTPRALRRREGERQLLAFPVEEGRPFPLEPLFCLARIRRVEGQLCAVYAFDREGRPLAP